MSPVYALLLAVAVPAAPARPVASMQNKHEVTMYSSQSCAPCRKAERWFQCIGLQIEHRDIDKEPAAGRRYKALKGWSLPLMFVDGLRMDGFQEKQLIDAFGQGEAPVVRDRLMACARG